MKFNEKKILFRFFILGHFSNFFSQVFEILLSVVQAPDSKTEENAGPTENCVSSIGKLLDFYPEGNFQFSFLVFFFSFLFSFLFSFASYYSFLFFLVFGDKLAEIFAAWVQMLPLEYDEVEARACHKHLCSFITRNNPHVFGNNLSNLPQLLIIFATILDSSDDEEVFFLHFFFIFNLCFFLPINNILFYCNTLLI